MTPGMLELDILFTWTLWDSRVRYAVYLGKQDSVHMLFTWMTPGIQVSVVNSYDAHSLCVSVNTFRRVDYKQDHNT